MSQEEMKGDEEGCQSSNILLLRLAISNSFNRIAESVSKEEFVDALTILKSNTSVARKLHEAMIKELRESFVDQLMEVFKDEDLQKALAKVFKLAEETDIPLNETAWRPPGDVKLHLMSMDAEKIKTETEWLEKWLNEMESENESLIKKLQEGRAEACTVHDRIMRNLQHAPFTLKRMENQLEELQCNLKSLEGD